MACQMDPNVYGFMCRCPMEDAAKLKQLADEAGMTLSGYLAAIIHWKVSDVALKPELDGWVKLQLERNLAHRKYQDEKTAAGYYRVKHPKKRGRPPKPKKRGRPPKKVRKPRSDKGIPRGPMRVVTPVINGEVIKAT